jgi:hypothetical protein
MLNPESLRAEFRRQPFVPLRLYLTGGKTYDIRHPEMAMITSREVYIGTETTPGSGVAKESDLGSLLHVDRVEQIPYSSSFSSSN